MANIIDAFLVTFGLDAAEFKKGAEEVKNEQQKIREDANKTADYMKKQGHEAAGFFKELILGAGSFLAMFASFRAVNEFIDKTAEADRTTGRLASILGITTEELSRYHGAVKLADGSAEGFNASMKSMGGMLVDIEKNLPRASRALTIFKAAGVEGLQLGKKTDILSVIDQLSEKMKGMDVMEAMRLGQRMGLDEGTIRLFREGKETINEWKKEMGDLSHTTQEDVDAFEALEDAQKKTAQAKEGVARVIMRALRPAIILFTQAVEKITVWVNQHSDAVRIAFIGISAAFVVLGVIAAKAAIAVIAATWPLLLIAAAIGLVAAGVAWLYNEWKKWTEGGQSSLGKLFAYLKAGWEAVKNLFVTQFNTILQTVTDVIDIIIGYFKFLWAAITLDLPGMQEQWNKLAETLGRVMKRLFNFILYELGFFIHTTSEAWNRMWDHMKEKASETLTAIGNWLRDLSPGMKVALGFATSGASTSLAALSTGTAGAGEAMHPYQMISSSSASSSSRSVSIGEMHVNAPLATDAKGIAEGMHEALASSGLVSHADSGMGG